MTQEPADTDVRQRGARPPRTARGEETRRRLLEAAERVFVEHGYHDASMVKITESAGVAQGTFYLYFAGKQQIFDELVEDLNRRVRRAMASAAHNALAADGARRIDAERAGFAAFFRFTAEHPALYRIIRQAEFVSPRALHLHYDRIVRGYAEALRTAIGAGEIAEADPDVLAWALIGVGEMIGMRWVLWGETREVPEHVYEEAMAFVARALGAPPGREIESDPEVGSGRTGGEA